jgi:hypothetical protein
MTTLDVFCGASFNPLEGCVSALMIASAVMVSPAASPLILENNSARWTNSSLRGFPREESPATWITLDVKAGIAGSCSAHAFKGFCLDPSASINRGIAWSSQNR